MAAKKSGGTRAPRAKKTTGTGTAGSNIIPFREDAPREAQGEPVNTPPTDQGETMAGHNGAEEIRLRAMDKALDEFCKLQDQEDALIEKYIAPIREKKNTVKSDLKRDYEIPVRAFNARAQLRRIELGDDPVLVMATNDMFKATPVGKNLDLVVLAEKVATKMAEAAAKKTKSSKVENVEHKL